MAATATNDRLATPTPKSRRMWLTTVATSAIATTSPTTDPITRIDALVVTGSRHARQLADTITLLKDRPAQTMPTRPASVATHRVLVGCDIAVLICTATVPPSPAASLMSAASNHRATKPSTPTTNSVSGTKKRNNRNASALPTMVPGRLPIALVDAQADVEQRAVVVLLDQLANAGLLDGDPLAAAVTSARTPVSALGSAPPAGSGVSTASRSEASARPPGARPVKVDPRPSDRSSRAPAGSSARPCECGDATFSPLASFRRRRPGGDVEPYAAHVPAGSPLVRWLGHASVLIEVAGVRVLADPALTSRLAHLRRHHAVDATAIGSPDVDPDLPRPHRSPARALAAAVRRRGADHRADRCRRVVAAQGLPQRPRDPRRRHARSWGAVVIETVPAVHPSSRGPHRPDRG